MILLPTNRAVRPYPQRRLPVAARCVRPNRQPIARIKAVFVKICHAATCVPGAGIAIHGCESAAAFSSGSTAGGGRRGGTACGKRQASSNLNRAGGPIRGDSHLQGDCHLFDTRQSAPAGRPRQTPPRRHGRIDGLRSQGKSLGARQSSGQRCTRWRERLHKRP
jgi:hypothetical protein